MATSGHRARIQRARSAPTKVMYNDLARSRSPSPPPQPTRALPKSRSLARLHKLGKQPMTEKQLLRRQLLSSASAVDRLNAPGSDPHTAWFDELAARERRAEAQHRRLEERELHKEDIQRAQLDALEMLRSGKVFINPIDRETLLRLVSGIRSQRLCTEPSPLAEPAVQLAAKPEVGSPYRSPVRPRSPTMPSRGESSKPGDGQLEPRLQKPPDLTIWPAPPRPPPSNTLEAKLARVVSTAHKVLLRQKQQQQRRQQQQQQREQQQQANGGLRPASPVALPTGLQDVKRRATQKRVRIQNRLQHSDKVYRDHVTREAAAAAVKAANELVIEQRERNISNFLSIKQREAVLLNKRVTRQALLEKERLSSSD